MGFISQHINTKNIPQKRQSVFNNHSQAAWREFFGTTDKESKYTPSPTPTRNDWSASATTSSNAAYKRLLDSFRSNAPGAWSDDRWEQSRHFVGVAYVAIHRLATHLSQAEFQVFQKDKNHPNGKKPVDGDHPLVRLLEKPNSSDSFGKLMYRWAQQKLLTGTALTMLVPNLLGTPINLYPIPTAVAVPQPVINPQYPHGYYRIQPVYPYGPFSSYPTPNSAVGAAVPAEWMMRFTFPHPFLRYEGYSPLTGLRLHLDEVEAMDRSRWHSMKRTINPSAVLNMQEMEGSQPLPEPEIDRIRAEFEASQMGVENVGQLFVATPGAKLEPWGTRPIDMDYHNGWDQLVSFSMGGLGITKPAAGMVEDSSYSTLFATLKQLNMTTLEPECNDIAADITNFLAPFFGDDLIVEIRCKRIDDHDIQFTKIDKAMQGKAITKNQLRMALDFLPTEEAWGNEIAGTEPQPEGGAGGLEGLMGAMGGNPGTATDDPLAAGADGQEIPPETQEEPGEVQNSRPDEEGINEGALGPRKSLDEKRSLIKKKYLK